MTHYIKKITLLILCFVIMPFCFSQSVIPGYEDGCIIDTINNLGGLNKYIPQSPLCSNSSVDYIPDGFTHNKIVNVNIHFMLRATGTPLNFTEIDDGNGNTYINGYDVANNLINFANLKLMNNELANLQCFKTSFKFKP